MAVQNVQLYSESQVLYLDALPPRLALMVQLLLRHQQVICAYEQGSVALHFNGPDVRPQLEKVSLNSRNA